MRTNAARRAAWLSGPCLLFLALVPSIARAQQPVDDGNLAVSIPGGAIHVEYDPQRLPVPRESLVRWVSSAARAVTAYFGRFPVPDLRLLVVSGGGGRIHSGFTASGVSFVRVALGSATTDADLDKDWVLTHEFVHLAHPSLGGQWTWMEEGIATYVEPLARVKAGTLGEDDVWRWLLVGLPKGLPENGDQGLDVTHTWGRTYWGGALFCLLADLEIRKETSGRSSLQTALRGVLEAGGDVRSEWTLKELVSAADRATGVPVLARLHARLGVTPEKVDLAALFQRLGVSLSNGRVVYDDSAPLAAVRRAISSREAARLVSQGTR